MKWINVDIIPWAVRYGLQEKHTKLLLFCILLLLIKFILVPLVTWQHEVKENTSFFEMQIRGTQTNFNQEEHFNKNIDMLSKQIEELETYYFNAKSSASAQLAVSSLLESYFKENGIKLESQRAVELFEKNGVLKIEYRYIMAGNTTNLQNFIFWLENYTPIFNVSSLSMSSSRHNSITKLSITFQQNVLIKE